MIQHILAAEVDGNVLAAVVASFSAVAVAMITTGRNAPARVIDAAKDTAKKVSEESCSDHLRQIAELQEEAVELRQTALSVKEQLAEVNKREDDCQAVLTVVLHRLGVLEEQAARREHRDGGTQ